MSEKTESDIKSVIKGIVVSVIFSLIGLTILTILVNITDLNEIGIKGINQFIKIISVFFGCMLSLSKNKGYIKGAIVGAIYNIFIYLLFLIIGGNLTFSGFIIDFICCTVIGFISGIISVNIKRKEE